MKEHKIVVLGTTGAGKTTLVATVSDSEHISTDVQNTDAALSKEMTTVAIDYGDINLPNGDRIRLYGTPGQRRFSFIWPLILEGAGGAIVMVDGCCADIQCEVETYLSPLAGLSEFVPAVVAITRLDQANQDSRERAETWMQANSTQRPVLAIDPRDSVQVQLLMDVLMGEIEAEEISQCLLPA